MIADFDDGVASWSFGGFVFRALAGRDGDAVGGTGEEGCSSRLGRALGQVTNF